MNTIAPSIQYPPPSERFRLVADAAPLPEELEKAKKNSTYERFMDFSKIVFSRESTYRGFVDVFAEDIPNILADAFRGKAAFIESILKSTLTTGYIFTAPQIVKKLAKFCYKAVLPQFDQATIDRLMLFKLTDLESQEKFNQAKQRIIKEEINDSKNQADFYQGSQAVEASKQADLEGLKNFLVDFNPDDKLRTTLYELKKNIFTKLAWYTSSMGTVIPIIKRLFRKYVLGLDRFVGSVKYLDDKNAEKLGSVKGFSLKQILMNIVSMVVIPSAFTAFMNFDKSALLKPIFEKLKPKIDTRHAYHPQTSLFAPISALPYLISKMINSQDRFELMENFIRFMVSGSSLYFGDRATNGVLAKLADNKLVEKHGVEPGVLYYKDHEDSRHVSGSLAKLFPEAAKFDHVLERTESNPRLREEATDLYRKVFYKGFGLHAFGTFALKMFINWITKSRVERALKHA